MLTYRKKPVAITVLLEGKIIGEIREEPYKGNWAEHADPALRRYGAQGVPSATNGIGFRYWPKGVRKAKINMAGEVLPTIYEVKRTLEAP